MSSPFVNPSTISEAGPSRKRARGDLSSEERKEARAHRNRIAAQNSRDRRKAQFGALERRCAELEDENRRLRAGYGVVAPAPAPAKSPEQEARDRENEELRERIKTLEKGWDAVVKALAAQGLPGLGLAAPDNAAVPSVPAPTMTQTPAPEPRAAHEFPSIAALPISPAPSPQADEDSPMFSADSTTTTDYSGSPSPKSEPTRHLARVATTIAPAVQAAPLVSLQRAAVAPVDDATMENLFREILATSPAPAPEATLFVSDAAAPVSRPEVTFDEIAGREANGSVLLSGASEELVWPQEELDVQRLIDLLPMESQSLDTWDFSLDSSNSIGVY
ncbi:hypothetical protein CYLTODRAFT_436809 [Cylindrobasidium torrendii FP15055 ss-10]|uniref:X-box-binding protein 1 n=1 Tax=Cylindrobasidium torrendii FP15055 ss-10 TaxID=1314674 RepID=A0A0D7BBK9_9AGAR|nr:hypothetical protein CYLTODRAFT_436809 [Cylindrobasidium torrendii FP15055 ss-10]